MNLRSWLSSTCSTTNSAATPPPKSPFSDTSSSYSDSTTQTNISSPALTSNSSIQSNLSLLTLPSVPSLQKLTLSPHPTPTPTLIASLKPTTPTTAHINSLTLHNNLLYAATGNQIHVYDTVSNTLFDTFNVEKSPTGSVKSIQFSNGKIYTAHQDCTIRVWKLSKKHHRHKLVAILPTVRDRLKRFIFPHNYIKVRRHKKKLWIEHHDTVSGLARLQNGDVVSVSWDGSIKIWNNLKCLESVNKAHHDAINAVIVSNNKDGPVIYTGSADKLIKVWKKDEKRKYGLVAVLEKHKSAVNALALSEDGSVLFSGSCDRSILVWEREDSASYMVVTGALRGHGKAILCLINVGDLLMSGSADRTVRIWRRGVVGMRYDCLGVLDGHRSPVRSLAAVEEEEGGGGGVKVFSGSFDGEIRVWQLDEVGK